MRKCERRVLKMIKKAVELLIDNIGLSFRKVLGCRIRYSIYSLISIGTSKEELDEHCVKAN